MAKKVIVVDDLDGSERDVVTHRFAIDGEYYEIDLCPQNLQDLRAALEPFVRAARRVRKSRSNHPEPAATTLEVVRSRPVSEFSREQRVAIRTWAREHGYDVADHGRFPTEVLAAYHEAQEDYQEAQG
jgi:Lsr2